MIMLELRRFVLPHSTRMTSSAWHPEHMTNWSSGCRVTVVRQVYHHRNISRELQEFMTLSTAILGSKDNDASYNANF